MSVLIIDDNIAMITIRAAKRRPYIYVISGLQGPGSPARNSEFPAKIMIDRSGQYLHNIVEGILWDHLDSI
jgi:hypothetical protein